MALGSYIPDLPVELTSKPNSLDNVLLLKLVGKLLIVTLSLPLPNVLAFVATQAVNQLSHQRCQY